jgi:hypothetical protein
MFKISENVNMSITKSLNGSLTCFTAVMVVVSLAGCSGEQHSKANLAWAESMKSMGYVPVYPPREDLRVGDLLLYPVGHSKSILIPTTQTTPRFLVSPSRWSAVNVANLLDEEYGNRASWPSTPEMYYHVNEDPEARTWEEPRAAEGQSIFQVTQTPYRLRSVLASLMSTYSDEPDNHILIPTEAINVAMGAAWQDRKAVSLRAGNAEEYSLSLQKLLPLVIEQRGTRSYLKDEYLASLALAHVTEPNTVSLLLVNEVIYIRSLDIAVQAQSETKPARDVKPANLMVNISETGMSSDSVVDPNIAPLAQTQKQVSIEGDTESIDPALAAFMRAQLLNRTLMQGDSDDQPDVFVRFISVTDESVSLRKIWRYGLAVGLKGMQLQVDKFTGEVISSDLMTTFFR